MPVKTHYQGDNLIVAVKSALNIVNIISEKVELKKAGKGLIGLCPFHEEKTPSFSVNPEKQMFRCFGCGAGGDIFKYYEMINNVKFKDALNELASVAGVSKDKLKKKQKSPFSKEYVDRLTKPRKRTHMDDIHYAEKGILYFLINRGADLSYIKEKVGEITFLDKTNNYLKTKLFEIYANDRPNITELLKFFPFPETQTRLIEIHDEFDGVDISTRDLLRDYIEVVLHS